MKKNILSFAIAAIIGTLSVSAKTVNTKEANGTNANTPVVSYLGSTEKGIVFNVNYANPQSSKFSVVVRNAAGDELYRETYKSKDFNKNFVLNIPSEDINNAAVTFELVGGKNEVKKSFDINSSVYTTQNITVKESAK